MQVSKTLSLRREPSPERGSNTIPAMPLEPWEPSEPGTWLQYSLWLNSDFPSVVIFRTLLKIKRHCLTQPWTFLGTFGTFGTQNLAPTQANTSRTRNPQPRRVAPARPVRPRNLYWDILGRDPIAFCCW